jgi:hypothetical protein
MQWGPRYDPNVVEDELFAAADSGGFFWLSKPFKRTSNINRVVDLGIAPNIVAFTCWLVNGGSNGYDERQEYARYLYNLLGDEPLLTGVETWNYPSLGSQITGSFPPGNPSANKNISVNHTPAQRP